MAEKQINPVLKQLLELGPPIAFFILYLRIEDRTFEIGGTEYSGFIVATVVFVPVMLAAMGILWGLTGKLSRIQIFTAIMVIFFGGLTAYFNDERFFKMKTSIVYGTFAALLGIGLLRGQSWLEFVIGEILAMEHEGWMELTRRLALMFLGLAIANEIVWRTMSEKTWVKIETFGFPIALFLFLWSQIVLLQHYLIEDEADDTA
jgi:intracellular septation protein